MERIEQRTRDTKEENTGRRKVYHTATTNSPGDGSNRESNEGARTITDANAKTPINQRKTKDTKRGRAGRAQTTHQQSIDMMMGAMDTLKKGLELILMQTQKHQ